MTHSGGNRDRVTAATRDVVRRLFAEADHGVVCDLLAEHCFINLPFCETWTVVQFERIHFAVLKLSDGDVGKLHEAIQVAKVDWRDTLVGSGFGHSVEEHLHWARRLRRLSDP